MRALSFFPVSIRPEEAEGFSPTMDFLVRTKEKTPRDSRYTKFKTSRQPNRIVLV